MVKTWRELLDAIMGLVIAVMLIYILILHEAQSEMGEPPKASEPPKEQCIDWKVQEDIRALTLLGIDNGLKLQVQKLFEIWVRDPHEQPKRATAGMRSVINAYLRARQNAEKWDPPIC
jgi:hypothetical protein